MAIAKGPGSSNSLSEVLERRVQLGTRGSRGNPRFPADEHYREGVAFNAPVPLQGVCLLSRALS